MLGMTELEGEEFLRPTTPKPRGIGSAACSHTKLSDLEIAAPWRHPGVLLRFWLRGAIGITV